jgi:hypothetical protein
MDNQILVYDAPKAAIGNEDYIVSVRAIGQPWQQLFVYDVKVDMHQVRHASMVYFDMAGEVEIRVECREQEIEQAVIRPLSSEVPIQMEDGAVVFRLDQPRKLVVEINGDRFSCLHVFANPIEMETEKPTLEDGSTLVLKPAIHRTEDIYRLAATPAGPDRLPPKVIYFAPGMHYLEETVLRIPSGMTVYIAGGAIVVGSMVCEGVEDVCIRGRGMLYLAEFHRFSAFRGIRIVFSKRVTVDGIIVVDPPHYSIYIGSSEHVQICNFKSFSTRGWSDGIDMMASHYIEIEDVFMRNSDDCIAIYGSRWDYIGDTRYVTVRNSVLWADVAHPLMIGTHGNHHGEGDIIEHIRFENIDILEHHEPQENYWGAMAINAGDHNTIRHVTYEDIRVEPFELGQLFDLRVVWNKDYNPVPGKRIQNITYRNISYQEANTNPNRIYGYDQERIIENVRFENVRINGKLVTDAEEGNIVVNGFVTGISFTCEEE